MNTNWIWGLVGGLMIGAAASFYLLASGRIMGASGIIGGLIDRSGWSTWAERLAFLAGLALIPALLKPIYTVPVTTGITGNLGAIVVAGLLVGIGTRLANGCTSGHGVCGISRLSLRGMVGWRHAFGDAPEQTFAFDGGSDFVIEGLPLAEDTLLLEAGIGFDVAPGIVAGLSYSGQIGDGLEDHGLNASLGVHF